MARGRGGQRPRPRHGPLLTSRRARLLSRCLHTARSHLFPRHRERTDISMVFVSHDHNIVPFLSDRIHVYIKVRLWRPRTRPGLLTPSTLHAHSHRLRRGTSLSGRGDDGAAHRDAPTIKKRGQKGGVRDGPRNSASMRTTRLLLQHFDPSADNEISVFLLPAATFGRQDSEPPSVASRGGCLYSEM